MKTAVYAADLIRELGLSLDIAELALDDMYACTLNVKDKVTVHIQWQEHKQSFVLTGYLGRIPSSNKVKVMEEVLKANLYWRGTEGATIAMGELDSDLLMIQAIHIHELDALSLSASINGFVSCIEKWRTQLGELEQVAEVFIHPGMYIRG